MKTLASSKRSISGSNGRAARRRAYGLLLAVYSLTVIHQAGAQGLHFSQFYNTPLLASPANTGLLPDKDFRVSTTYRSQWGAVPVPFNTFSAAADAQVFRRKNETNWLGLGGAVFTDKSGDGNLSTTRIEGFAAYHIILGEHNMISLGASLASVQRSVDFSKLTFDAQWDGFAFDTKASNREVGVTQSTAYADISAGASYAFFPNELLYIKLGAGLAHLNRARETFLNRSNEIGFRPTVNLDVTARLGDYIIVNPAAYYTSQKGAFELLYGTLAFIKVGAAEGNSGSLIFGAYQRWNDAVVGAFGYEWKGIRFMSSYDHTTSTLGQYISHNGAVEFSLSWQGMYGTGKGSLTKMYTCPRF